MWQAAIDLETEGAERLRGALERAALARAAGERIDEALQRITLMLGTQPRIGEETSLSAIEADIAALTLGLGFGLQEVVANFVSGIIMLFERPVRVGDTITIGEYSGTVARIRTRATTIVDWDNREIVVPNKNFITERLINWTLSDTMTRIVIPVGVSYDADVDEVMGTLKTIAEESPLVLKEPAPTVLFLKFGDSALSFELRVYVNAMKDRLITISELHRTIIKEFRDKGIEIAYPQMDIHVRDLPPAKRAGQGHPEPPRPDPQAG
nr:mechanosensitive ion channel domain-containing protein [Thioalkalivibrio sulfidiphilus]